jgi:hypothetical protein
VLGVPWIQVTDGERREHREAQSEDAYPIDSHEFDLSPAERALAGVFEGSGAAAAAGPWYRHLPQRESDVSMIHSLGIGERRSERRSVDGA